MKKRLSNLVMLMFCTAMYTSNATGGTDDHVSSSIATDITEKLVSCAKLGLIFDFLVYDAVNKVQDLVNRKLIECDISSVTDPGIACKKQFELLCTYLAQENLVEATTVLDSMYDSIIDMEYAGVEVITNETTKHIAKHLMGSMKAKVQLALSDSRGVLIVMSINRPKPDDITRLLNHRIEFFRQGINDLHFQIMEFMPKGKVEDPKISEDLKPLFAPIIKSEQQRNASNGEGIWDYESIDSLIFKIHLKSEGQEISRKANETARKMIDDLRSGTPKLPEAH